MEVAVQQLSFHCSAPVCVISMHQATPLYSNHNGMHIFIEGAADFLEPVLEDGLWAPPLDADHSLHIVPGGLYRWSTIVELGVSVEQMSKVHLELLVALVRDDAGGAWHPRLLTQLDPSVVLADFLFTPWAHQLSGEVADILKISMADLISGGLTRRMVRRRWWRYSLWTRLFGMNAEHLTQLGIQEPAAYFPLYLDDEMMSSSVAEPLLRLNL